MPASGAAQALLQRVEHGGGVAACRGRATGWSSPIEPIVFEQAPEGAEQAEEDQQADRDSARCRGFRRGAWRWNRASMRIELVEKAIDDERPISAFIGASSTGSVVSEPARKELTQRTSRNSRPTWAKASRMPIDQHADDQAVEAGIGGEGRRDLAGQDGGDEGDDGQEDDHRSAGRPAGSTVCADRSPGRRSACPFRRI